MDKCLDGNDRKNKAGVWKRTNLLLCLKGGTTGTIILLLTLQKITLALCSQLLSFLF
jgi:hypothetical protein